MILRKPELSDVMNIWEFLNKQGLSININSVLNNIMDEGNESIMKINGSVKGVILAKGLPSMLEIRAWGLKREDRSLFEDLFKKSRSMGYRRVGVIENNKNRKRIKTLEKLGFKVASRQEGIFPKNKAVILRRRI